MLKGRAKTLLLLVLSGCLLSSGSRAEPVSPTRDSEIVEVLPAASGNRDEARRMRKLLAARPADARLAVSIARRDLQQAREAGDPRFAGLALAALSHWPSTATAPDDVLLLQATVQQYLHDFDTATQSLRVLLARPSGQKLPQAWLTLATIYRVQARYADSDDACKQVASAGSELHSAACLAENAALQGRVSEARKTFQELLARQQPADIRGWLLTSLAELEVRDGKAKAAEAAFRGVLALGPDSYAAVDYADFLIDQSRPCEVAPVLKQEIRTDAVLLRLAIAGLQCKSSAAGPTTAADVAEMRDRIALANQRADAKIFHGREQAMFALQVDKSSALAVELARGNAERQREAIDILVFAEAARASGNPVVVDEVRKLQRTIGLHDRRVDALL